MKNKTKYTIILALMILATIASIILTFIPLQKACGASEGCSIVNTSQYETTLGIKNAHIGLIAFPILAILTILELRKSHRYQKRLITLGMLLGSAFAIYFLYIQFFVLKALCKYCLVVDIGVILSLGLILFFEEKIEGKK
ncbi:MAG: vitamin K epoxide reductase family protein [Candidatus Paceibacterota bacterium]|jgi:uncharacterized membrane protein